MYVGLFSITFTFDDLNTLSFSVLGKLISSAKFEFGNMLYSCRKSHTDIHYMPVMLTLDDWSERIGKKKRERERERERERGREREHINNRKH
jgi:hypothetical protein